MKKNWIVPPPLPTTEVEKIAIPLGISKITAEILINKGYKTIEEAYKFINPRIEHLLDPFIIPQMEFASKRIIKAIDSHEKILIYGDYDVDGITATALIYNALKRLNTTPEIYIPNRIEEGYGLTKEGVEYCLKSYVNLIITVDCGIGAMREIEVLQSNGIDVIVTDHHHPGEKLPDALAVIKGEGGLSGCGIAFKLMQAVYKKLGVNHQELLEYMDLIALATVCDVTPITGENRIFTKYGMKTLERTKNLGLKALLEGAGLKGTNITPYHLGFILGPRINAQGRLGNAKETVKLLTTQDRGEAEKIAQKIEKANQIRQDIQNKILEEAVEEIKKSNLNEKMGIVIEKEGWHPGVIGIVASKIQEKFYRPTILIAINGETGKGSARSIPQLHLYNTLSQCSEYLINFGGHKLAAGFTISTKNIQPFKEKFNYILLAQLNYEELMPKFQISKEINLKEIDENLAKEIERLEPFGLGNPRPLFLSKEVQVVGTPEVVKKEHLKFKVRVEGNKTFKSIGFEMGEVCLLTGQYINLIYEITQEEFMGKSEIVLQVKDLEIVNY